MKNSDPPYHNAAGFRLQGTPGVTLSTGKKPDRPPVSDPDAGRFVAVRERKAGGSSSRQDVGVDQDFNMFQDRTNRNNRVKLCVGCGGTMKKSSRTVLSIPAGMSLAALGVAFMTLYGYAANFYQVPWFIKFALPAVYYIGSIFVALGLLFFFIKEKIWKCERCGEISKR